MDAKILRHVDTLLQLLRHRLRVGLRLDNGEAAELSACTRTSCRQVRASNHAAKTVGLAIVHVERPNAYAERWGLAVREERMR